MPLGAKQLDFRICPPTAHDDGKNAGNSGADQISIRTNPCQHQVAGNANGKTPCRSINSTTTFNACSAAEKATVRRLASAC
jgi:hypothetical protein